MEELGRIRTYEPAAVEALFSAVADERRRLEAALEAARERVAVARARLADADATVGELAAIVLEAARQHAELETDAAGAVEELLVSAEAEAQVVIALARAECARRKLADSFRRVSEHLPALEAEVIDLDRHRIVEVG